MNKNLQLSLIACVVVILGVTGAWFMSSKMVGKPVSNGAAPGAKVTSTEAGILDPNTKYDEATGDLKDGGLNEVGTQHLERDGGPTHYVALTSSVVDLSTFVGKKVRVWGTTSAAKKTGWLLEVAKVQVVQ
jgi:hypothetical protein